VIEFDEGFDPRAPAESVELSAEGDARREAMLRGLKEVVLRRRFRRRAARRTAVAALLAAPVAAFLLRAAWPERERHAPGEAMVASPPAALSLRLENARLEVVRTPPPPLERYLARPSPPDPATYLDDKALLSLLARSGRPAGLVRVGGRVFLTEN